MTTANHESSPAGAKVRIGLAAPAADAALAEAIQACAALELAAQWGMPRESAVAGVEWCDDLRVLLSRSGVQAVVIAGSPRAAVEICRLAAEHGIHTWRRWPLGRTFAEAVEALRTCRAAGVVARVYSWWEHVRDDVLWALGEDPAGGGERAADGERAVYAAVRVHAAGPGLDGWGALRAEAGGGVLAQSCYELLECAYVLRGLPESIHAALGRGRNRIAPPQRETEDVAAAIFRYDNAELLQVQAAWDVPPYGASLTHYAARGAVRIAPHEAVVLDERGAQVDRRSLPADLLAAELADFAREVRSGRARDGFERAQERHLALAAILEASYLSARTGQLESPRRLYDLHKWPEPKG